MADDLKQKVGSAVILLGSVNEGKVNLIAAVTKDLIEKGYHAGKLIKEVATRAAVAAEAVQIWLRLVVKIQKNSTLPAIR